jgi:uncharacterized LabA/DUF88 family protein
VFQARYAILLDGGFVTKRIRSQTKQPATADDVVAVCDKLRQIPDVSNYELLRIYYYDASPSVETIKLPVSRSRHELAKTARFWHAQSLYTQLVMRPDFALRVGETILAPNHWRLKPKVQQEMVAAPRALTDADFDLDISQKGVDMRIGMDMARLALRELVRAVVVVTSDSDFVPAFKFVRREGVRVVLVTLGHKNVRLQLREHADIFVPTLP